MSNRLKYLAAGFVAGIIFTVGVIAALLFSGNTTGTMTIHETQLPSGKQVQVTMCALVWGVGHEASERNAALDQFQLEFVSSIPAAAPEARNQEVLDAFELIRSASEQWGLTEATVSVFPTVYRRGRYETYDFKRGNDGKWTSEHHTAKVHIND